MVVVAVVVAVVVGVAVVVVVGVEVGVEVVVGVEVEVGVVVVKGGSMAKLVSPLSVGRAVLLRTVTHYYTGRIALIRAHEIVLTEAAWIADTGRWWNALKEGKLAEVEPFIDPVSVNRDVIVDCTEWRHALPAKQV